MAPYAPSSYPRRDRNIFKKAIDNRIWELDFARGVAIICMCIVHFFVFLGEIGGQNIYWSPFFLAVLDYGGAFFVLLSGVCAAFSRNSVKRGLTVFGCGMVLTAVTSWLYLTGREDEHILIQWGVLHLIGFCMIVYPLLKRMPPWLRLIMAFGIIISGYGIVRNTRADTFLLFPLGIRPAYFPAWDYFPIFPHLGWFMAGTCLKDVMYKEKKSMFSADGAKILPVRLLCLAGRYSLYIYMLHLPVLYVGVSKYFG